MFRGSVILSVSVALGFAACASSVSAASPPPRISLLPTNARGVELPGTSYYQLNLRPGSTIHLYTLVENLSSTTVIARLVPVDAISGVYGGISYNLPQQPRTRVGRWIHVSHSVLSLAPGKGQVVGFTVHVPRKAPGGQHIGGLTAFVPAHVKASAGFGGLTVQLRTVVAVQVTLPAPVVPKLHILSVRPRYEPTGLYLITTIANHGNRLLGAHGALALRRLGTSTDLIDQPLGVDTTVPHTRVHYPVAWPGHAPVGTYHATAVLRWPEGQTRWSGELRIGSVPPGAPKPPKNGPQPSPVTSDRSVWTSVGLLTGGIAAGSLAMAWFLVWSRRRRQTDSVDAGPTPVEAF